MSGATKFNCATVTDMADQTAPDSGGLRSRAEAAEYLSMSMRRLDELIKSGALCAVRDGRSVKVSKVELERYIAHLPAWEPDYRSVSA